MPQIEVSVGELVDKVTILEIKEDRIEDETKLDHIRSELGILKATIEQENIAVPEELIQELKDINVELWDAEDVIRACENDKRP